VNKEFEALKRRLDHQTGRRRLSILLALVSGGLCFMAMAATVIVYGTPYDPMWWWAMGGILLAAVFAPVLLVAPIEWVIEGYMRAEGKR
jgi:hypothetical protein